MPDEMERITRWWERLSEEERAAVLADVDSGELSQGARESLERAGVLRAGEGGRAIPPQVLAFLKMRHRTTGGA